MSGNVNEIRMEPVDVEWQIEQQDQITCVADVSSNLNNKWFKIGAGASGADTWSHYVWFNVGAAGVDPAPAGLTELEVAISANATATAVASAAQAVIDAHASFLASASSGVLTITNAAVGLCGKATDGTAATGFAFSECQRGVDLDLGFLDGDLEIAFEQQLFEVKAHQTGSTLLAELRQGATVEVSLVLKESDKDTWKQLFTATAGGSYGTGANEIFGWGTSRVGVNTAPQAARLHLHPVALSSTDYSRDWTFWKAYPMPESATFSGENPNVMSVSFKCYRDESRDGDIEIFAIGNYTSQIPLQT
jgi:hypothetical protein